MVCLTDSRQNRFICCRPQSALAEHRLRAPKLVCFNLGWLPSSGRKDVITTPGTTLRALQQAHALVAEGGFVCVIAYTGHAGMSFHFHKGFMPGQLYLSFQEQVES